MFIVDSLTNLGPCITAPQMKVGKFRDWQFLNGMQT